MGDYTLREISIDGELKSFVGATATISFESTGINIGSVGGNNGCNEYGGDYTILGIGEIDIGPLFSTYMACDGAKGELESLFMPHI